MSAGPWAFLSGAVGAAVTSAAVTVWLLAEPEAKLVVAAVPIAEGDSISIGMLEMRAVPTRFVSKRKLGVSSVAGVMGQVAPHDIRAGDFIDPLHFSERPDECALEVRSVARELGLDGQTVDDFVKRLGRAR